MLVKKVSFIAGLGMEVEKDGKVGLFSNMELDAFKQIELEKEYVMIVLRVEAGNLYYSSDNGKTFRWATAKEDVDGFEL